MVQTSVWALAGCFTIGLLAFIAWLFPRHERDREDYLPMTAERKRMLIDAEMRAVRTGEGL